MSKTRMLCLALMMVCSMVSVSLAQSQAEEDLETALKANEFLKERIKKMQQDQIELLKKLKAITLQNSLLKDELESKGSSVSSQAQAATPAVASVVSDEMMRLKKELQDTHYNLGAILQENNRLAEARKEYEKALEINPEDADALYNLALVLDQTNNGALAVEYYLKFLKINSQSPEAQEVKRAILRLSK